MVDQVLKYSLDNRMSISIIYMKGLEISQRKIQVKSIEGNGVKAYCYQKNAIRTFKKKNILSAMIQGVHIKNYGNISI